jgi:SAM-dependent methyltransferase
MADLPDERRELVIHHEVVAITDRLRARMADILGDQLLGLYLFGSAVTGSYENGISDVDLLAVLYTDLSDRDAAALASMHAHISAEAPEWSDRVEVAYAGSDALAASMTGAAPAARISPGEPFHQIEIDRRWVLDWYPVLTYGRTLLGPPPETLLPSISSEDFLWAVRDAMARSPARVAEDLDVPGRVYALLTISRGWRFIREGDQVSKRQAATWAAQALPKFADLLDRALDWRSAASKTEGPELSETRRFVAAVFADLDGDAPSAAARRAQVRRGYDAISREYRFDDGTQGIGEEGGGSRYREWVNELRDIVPPPSRILDLGCGAGVPATKLLVEAGYEVVGLDFSHVQIERARQLVPRATFVEADIAEWNCPPASFDAIVSFYALIHVPLADQQALIPRIRRWLKPGGYFMAIVGHHAWSGVEEYFGVPMFWDDADESTYLRWLQDAGLNPVAHRFVPEGDSGHTLVLCRAVVR